MKKVYFIFLNLFFFSLTCYAQDPCSGVQTVEYGGKTYHTVAIKNQCWLKENLNIGNVIPAVQGAQDNGIIEKSCYDDNPGNCDELGGLYQWNEVMQYAKNGNPVRGICPEGWHVPSEAEFETLKASVNGDGNALKELGEGSGDGEGTNTSGFSALMAIGNYNGMWYSPHMSYFWSSTGFDARTAITFYLSVKYSPVFIDAEDKDYGFPVRCIKDNNTSDIGGKDPQKQGPDNFSLSQNYPNPFNPVTVISYDIPENIHVTLRVYDAIGNEVATLVNEYKTSGSYRASFDGSKLPSGIYYYELSAGSYKRTNKMTLIK